MSLYEVEPPAKLRQVIKNFWHFRLDLGQGPASLEVQPDSYAEIIFYFGSAGGLTLQQGGPRLPSPFLTGLLDRPVRFTGSGWLDVVGIKCFPWAVFDLLGLPAGRGGVQTVPHPLAQLQVPLQQLVEVGQVQEALAQAAQYFQTAWSEGTNNLVLEKAGAAMRRANGTLLVREVAAAAHTTVRTLERRFKQAAGHTVKDVSALMRFEQVRDRLWCNPAANMAGLAHEIGYADQSHLGQEFKRYSSTTPAAFARQVRQVRQLVDRDFVAFVLT